MKPGDHPEFFRFAPPPGTSRESSIRLDREGRFFHDGELVEHKALAEALASWVSVHPDDGRYILTNGYDWCYFEVEDTAWFVMALAGQPPGAPTLLLSDGTREALEPGALALDREGRAIALVKRGLGRAHRARFTRHAQLALEPWLSEGEPPKIVIDGVPVGIGGEAD
ncbi:MAG: hypothetical protein U0271_07595 [Polyangiaceae bacterium]